MKLTYTLTLIVIIAFSAISFGQAENELIPIIENNLWGFIDSEGEYVIKPRFHSVGRFSSGLAPVRENAHYGYINTSGKFIISPKYDFALPFMNDIAKIYIQGKPFFIDKNGKILFSHDFIEFHHFEHRNITFALAKNNRYAVVNKSGKIIIEPVFNSVSRFNDGLAIVQMPSSDSSNVFFGVIDEDGQYVVDFGEYDNIEPYVNGFAKVSNYDNSFPLGTKKGIINENGELIFNISEKDFNLSSSKKDFVEGVAIVDIVEKNVAKNDLGIAQKLKKGFINEAGELIFERENVKEITYFNHNRAFLREEGDKWSLIDKRGNIIKDNLPGGLLENKTKSDTKSLPFLNGIEILETPKGFIVIDTSGNPIHATPRTFGRLLLEKRRVGNILIYKQKIESKEGHLVERYGFWDLETNLLTKAKFDRIMGFTPNGFFRVVKGNDECIVDRAARIVWIQRNKNAKVLPLNIDYMLNGYFYAYSFSADKKEFNVVGGGHSKSNNFPRENTKKHKFPENRFSLIVRTNERTTFDNHTIGYKVYIANSSRDTVYFKAKDSRLEMVVEGLNANGNWQNIEYLPKSFCAHSFHTLDLPPNYNWELSMPQYTGTFKTKLRIKLVHKTSLYSNETTVIYSNEFSASINPTQFWRQENSFNNMPKE